MAALGLEGKGPFSIRGSAPTRRDAPSAQRQRDAHLCPLVLLLSPHAGARVCLDMRCEEECRGAHSRARQEQLQLINSQLREEDDKWQDVSAGATAGQWRDRAARWARGPLEQRIRINRLGGSLGLESHAEERRARKRLQTVNTAHVGIKESLLKFGQKAEGAGGRQLAWMTNQGCTVF